MSYPKGAWGIWARLGMTKGEFQTKLRNMYRTMGQEEIGRQLSVSIKTINKNIQEMGISRTSSEAKFFRYARKRANKPFSVREKKILNGILLSDGHIRREGDQNARLTFGFKHRETIERIVADLPSVPFAKPKPYYVGGAYTTKKSKVWYSRSLSDPRFNEFREMWYPDGRKHIPTNHISLTPETVYWWYVGDGSLHKIGYNIQLYANSRSPQELEWAVREFAKRGIVANRKAWGLNITRSNVPSFLRYIGPCRNPEYAYKWAYKAPLTKKAIHKIQVAASRQSWQDPARRKMRIAKLRVSAKKSWQDPKKRANRTNARWNK